jgi:hypothetical protein
LGESGGLGIGFNFEKIWCFFDVEEGQNHVESGDGEEAVHEYVDGADKKEGAESDLTEGPSDEDHDGVLFGLIRVDLIDEDER